MVSYHVSVSAYTYSVVVSLVTASLLFLKCGALDTVRNSISEIERNARGCATLPPLFDRVVSSCRACGGGRARREGRGNKKAP
jgi:hypothetical protein